MARKKKQSQQPVTASRPEDSLHPALKLRHTLRGHTHNVYRMALSPDGRILASPSNDNTVRLWDVESGQLLRTLEHEGSVICVAWSPNGKTVVTGDDGLNEVYLWDATTGQQLGVLGQHRSLVLSVAWSPERKMVASCSGDSSIHLWNARTERSVRKLTGHAGRVARVAWSPDGSQLCSVSWDQTAKLWDTKSGKVLQTLEHKSMVHALAWSPDGVCIASGDDAYTVHIWEYETGWQVYVLEGHTAPVVAVSFLDDGRLLASLDQDGAAMIWRTDTWNEVMRVDKIGDIGILANMAVHATLPMMAVRGNNSNEINIWEFDLDLLRGSEPESPTIYYVNAKAVLLGDSGVGKSGLGIRIAEGAFRHTEGSTHGAQFWHFPTDQLPDLSANVQAELTLWDLAGQPEYRLTHQLFLDDTDAALLLFDCSDASDPFRGVPYWAKVLRKLAPSHALKYLVSARCDVSPVTVDRRDINHMLAEYGLDEYYKTSASTGEGVETLFKRLLAGLPWDQLPRTSTPQLFQIHTRVFARA